MRMMETEDPLERWGWGWGAGTEAVEFEADHLLKNRGEKIRRQPKRSSRIKDHFPQDLDILSTLADSEGEVGMVLEVWGALEGPGLLNGGQK